MAYADEVLNLNPLSYWKLDEKSGTNAVDEIGNHPGTYENGFTLEQEPLIETGRSVDFNNEGRVNTNAQLDGDPLTILCWVNPSTLGGTNSDRHTIVTDRISNNTWSYILRIEGNEFQFYIEGDSSVAATSSTTVQEGTTYFLAAVYDGTEAQLYIDANSEDTVSVSNRSDTTGDVSIGARNDLSDEGFIGRIDEVAVYKSALTTNDIQTIYDERNTTLNISGIVEGETDGSTIAATISVYRQSDGIFIDKQVLDGSESNYNIKVLDNESHTIVAIPPNGSGLPSKVLHDVTPIEQ